jgi:hypothetical protein
MVKDGSRNISNMSDQLGARNGYNLLKTAVEKTKWLLLTKPLAKKLEQQ